MQIKIILLVFLSFPCIIAELTLLGQIFGVMLQPVLIFLPVNIYIPYVFPYKLYCMSGTFNLP